MYHNYTPHTLRVHLDGELVLELEPEGKVPRVQQEEPLHAIKAGGVIIESVPIGTKVVDDEEMLQAIARSGGVAIVSAMVAQATKRLDVVSPGQLIRDDKGRPIGCEGLISWVNDTDVLCHYLDRQ
tara:strand:+ start:127 stop:504 length:378 start_codon:yes stop_codon:yes gene_type:complete